MHCCTNLRIITTFRWNFKCRQLKVSSNRLSHNTGRGNWDFLKSAANNWVFILSILSASKQFHDVFCPILRLTDVLQRDESRTFSQRRRHPGKAVDLEQDSYNNSCISLQNTTRKCDLYGKATATSFCLSSWECVPISPTYLTSPAPYSSLVCSLESSSTEEGWVSKPARTSFNEWGDGREVIYCNFLKMFDEYISSD